jgi:hypothetical protein
MGGFSLAQFPKTSKTTKKTPLKSMTYSAVEAVFAPPNTLGAGC